MLNWVLTFLVVALVAAVLGFGGLAGSAVEIAKLIFYVAIGLFVISAVMHWSPDAARRYHKRRQNEFAKPGRVAICSVTGRSSMSRMAGAVG